MPEPKKPTQAAAILALLRRLWLTVLLVGGPAVWAVIINLPMAEPEVSVLTSGKMMISNEERPFRAHVVYSPGYLISIGGLRKFIPSTFGSTKRFIGS